MNGDETYLYVARLIWIGGIHQELEFEARNDLAAWEIAHESPIIDPLRGTWVEVKRLPDPQQRLEFG